jgi:protein-disulfide isomerase
MDKRFWAVIAAIILVFGGIVIANNRKDSNTSGSGSTAAATNHVEGSTSKGITLVEYGDFQCPVCGLYEPTVKQVAEKYKDSIQLQFRHFPLQQVHPNAFAGSRAAEAAGVQGKFWEMHAMLYDHQNDWSTASDPVSIFTQYAKSIGINTDQFKTDFTSSKVNDAINADIAAGNKLNVSGTPTFYLNGEKVELSTLVGSDNYPNVDKFSAVIDAAIKKADDKQKASASTTTDSTDTKDSASN